MSKNKKQKQKMKLPDRPLNNKNPDDNVSDTDPLGSYTGEPSINDEMPTQDADDL